MTFSPPRSFISRVIFEGKHSHADRAARGKHRLFFSSDTSKFTTMFAAAIDNVNSFTPGCRVIYVALRVILSETFALGE